MDSSVESTRSIPDRSGDPTTTRTDLGADVERYAQERVDALLERGLIGGRNPGGVAAGCLYHASLVLGCEAITQKAATVADVSPVTIRSAVELVDQVE
ncbi:hypothetical protein [Natronosalvus rutilus]|uniref:Transcription factor TFIIB cyclin-like domain-containing protein n=1 Tax=Natronosalvus rutilus TaxID=2953753 RepID=A0A9E7SVC1_9EURY|nr:hypothetical protein [Natronosalvus rutilus]UTF54355.1 hypothetical protein NGM29_03485 [Natronosalvus rutilus]